MGTKVRGSGARPVALDEANPLLMANGRFRKALEQIFDLALDEHKVAGGSKEDPDLLLFVFLAVRRRRRTGTPKEHWERTFAQDTGKTWKALSEFPDRLKRIAGELEHLSGNWPFDPVRAFTSEEPLAIYAKREFPILPTTLRNYANWLAAQVNAVSGLMKNFYLRAPRGRLSLVTLQVSEQVKLITGRVCDPQVAELLNAADLVLNPGDSDSGDRFDEQAIALMRSREKRKTHKT